MIDAVLFICNLALLVPALRTMQLRHNVGPLALQFAIPLTVMAFCFCALGLYATAAVVGVTACVWWRSQQGCA